jgi:predicted phosphodiesterase
MRLGVLSDVHANLHALDAVLARLDAEGVERYLCAGDLVGYGPFPNECVAVVATLPGACVAGNHDLIAVGELSTDRCNALARDSLKWTAAQLTPATRARLAELPRLARFDHVVMAHGSLHDPQEYLRTSEQAVGQLDVLAEEVPGAEILVVGHTHRAMAIDANGGLLLHSGVGTVALDARERHLLNPGSVGQSRDARPQARALVLDLDAREASFVAVDYDRRGTRRALRRAGRPPWSCHVSPTPTGRARRRIGRALG